MNDFIDIPTKIKELKEKKKENEEKEESKYQEWKNSILQQDEIKLNNFCKLIINCILKKGIQIDEIYKYTFTLNGNEQIVLKVYNSINNYSLTKNEYRFISEKLTDTLAPHYPMYEFIYDFNFKNEDSYILSITFCEKKNTFIYPYTSYYPIIVDKYKEDILEEVDGIASLFGSNDDF
jgi:hypothetical protein